MSPVVPELAVLVGFVVVVLSVWKLGLAWRAGRRRGDGEPVTVRRVRFEHRMRSRGYLETDSGGRREWWPIYFDTGLLGIAPDEPARRGPVRLGRAAFRMSGGVVAVPSGRRRRSQPPGTLLDAPRLNDADLTARTARFGSVRRRVVLDGPAVVAAPIIGLLWLLSAGGGVVGFVAVTVLAAVTAVWSSAITGSDPS